MQYGLVIRMQSFTHIGNVLSHNSRNVLMFRVFLCSSINYSHIFSYALETNTQNAVTALVNMDKIDRVAATLENGRIFILDSTLIPLSSVYGEGSFVLSELGTTGSLLYSSCVLWSSDQNM